MKAVFGKWELIGVADLNRLLKPFGVRLIKKTSKEWQGQVTITAQATGVGIDASGVVKAVEVFLEDAASNLVVNGHLLDDIERGEMQREVLQKLPAFYDAVRIACNQSADAAYAAHNSSASAAVAEVEAAARVPAGEVRR